MVCTHWEVAYPYRHSAIEKMHGYADKIPEVWPHLSKPFGSSLVGIT